MGFVENMSEKKSINALVSGGEASAGPPLGPALGPIGVNVLQVVNAINEKTKEFPGMKVPVKVEVDSETKQFTVEVGIPPTAALILKEAGITKGSGNAGTASVGKITMNSIVKIAKMKIDNSYASSLKSAVKEVVGSCLSLGILVDDKTPMETYNEIKQGKFKDLF
jgi:large subunit ribosomal protein L11